jgi:hypothetical protein
LTISAFAQGQYKAPRTADGHPDFQGFWANNNATPVERPKELADHPVLTDAEVAAMRKRAKETFLKGDEAAAFGDSIFLAVWDNLYGSKTKKKFESFEPSTGDYSSEWNDERDWDNRTSLITDPADGRFPPVTERVKQMREKQRIGRNRPAEGPEDRGFSERCLTYGSPSLQAGYQSYYQIVQSGSSVMMLSEMIHDARVINLDNRPHPSDAVQEWKGDSRGHWEGDTLVVDTTNYRPQAFLNVSSEKLHLTERFTRQDAETIRWEITVNDPDTWTKPFSLMIPLKRSAKPIFEYACHEGNYGLKDILAGARAEEAAAKEQAAK